MTDQQPTALWLADALEARHAHFYGANSVPSCMTDAAAELRRLHDLLGKSRALNRIRAERIKELEQALGMAVDALEIYGAKSPDVDDTIATARQALGGAA